jgi:hypothetical protein
MVEWRLRQQLVEMAKLIFDSPEAFVRAYMEAFKNGDPMEDFAKRFNSNRQSMQAKVGKFRMQGMKLPSLPLKRGIDVPKLNAIVQEMMASAPTSAAADNSETFNATCADCQRPFYSSTGAARYCPNCIKKHPRERTYSEANRAKRETVTRACLNCGKLSSRNRLKTRIRQAAASGMLGDGYSAPALCL